MKQFNLKEYLANPSRKVVTREGCPVRILCTDKKSYNEQIVGLIMGDNGMEYIFTWTQQGKQYINMDTPNDLFFAPEKHTGWVSICRRFRNNGYFTDGIFDSEEKAKERGGCIATVKIEWEE